MEFKVGDLVKVRCGHYLNHYENEIATIVVIGYSDVVYVQNDEIRRKYPDGWSVHIDNLIKVEDSEDLSKPKRYNKRGKLECWDVILDQEMNFLEGSIQKYLWRYKEKGGVKDLEKAKIYIDKLIEEFTKKS